MQLPAWMWERCAVVLLCCDFYRNKHMTMIMMTMKTAGTAVGKVPERAFTS